MPGSVAKRQDAVKAFSDLVVRVFRLNGALTAAGDALAQPDGQTSARWRVLAAVEHEPMTVAQIARAWSLARQSVQRVADLLERDGLVTYEPNPAPRRARHAAGDPGRPAGVGGGDRRAGRGRGARVRGADPRGGPRRRRRGLGT